MTTLGGGLLGFGPIASLTLGDDVFEIADAAATAFRLATASADRRVATASADRRVATTSADRRVATTSADRRVATAINQTRIAYTKDDGID